jgi:hypothetical protein
MARLLNRDDLTTEIPEWFNRAYHAAMRRHNFLAMESIAYTGMLENQEQFAAPNDFKHPILLYTWDPFTSKLVRMFVQGDIDEIRKQRTTNILEKTSIYALWNNTFEIRPPIGPGEAPLQLRLDYYAYLDPPGSAEATFFTNHGEDYLIYRGLEESAPFLGADKRLQTWMERATNAWNDLYRADMEARYSGPLIMRG